MTEQPKDKIIKKIDDFMQWVSIIGTPYTLYRGTSRDYPVSSSLFRRSSISGNSEPDALLFQQDVKELVETARRRGHGFQKGRRLADLELLAELQHYGAATCLIDFTHNALIALWFACKPAEDNKKNALNGKVVCCDSNADKYLEISSEHLDYGIERLLEEGDENLRKTQDMILVWPPYPQNDRIIAQKSVFLFGPPKISVDNQDSCIVSAECKKTIRQELQKYDISEETLFCDFHGFAQTNAQNKGYSLLSPQEYFQKGEDCRTAQLYKRAIHYYRRSLKLDHKYAPAYYGLARAQSEIGKHHE